MRRVCEHFQKRRLERGLTVPQLARMIGYKNVCRGVRRINVFEQTGHAHPDLVTKLANALDVDQATVTRLAYDDYRDWIAATNKPVPPYLVRRLLYGGGVRRLPRHLHSAEAAEKYAADFAKEVRLRGMPDLEPTGADVVQC